jgi:hypothetical protein
LPEGLVSFGFGLLHDEAALVFGDRVGRLADVGEVVIIGGILALILLEEFVVLGLVGGLEYSESDK